MSKKTTPQMGAIPDYWSEDWLTTEYIENNRSKSDIAKSQSVDPSTIQRWLNEYEIRKSDGEKLYQNESWLRDRYENRGYSAGTLADEADCSKTTILNYLDEFNIETREKNEG